MESFCYLGSIIEKLDGSSADVANRINKARNDFAQLNPVAPYSYETSNIAPSDCLSIQVFVNKCLR